MTGEFQSKDPVSDPQDPHSQTSLNSIVEMKKIWIFQCNSSKVMPRAISVFLGKYRRVGSAS